MNPLHILGFSGGRRKGSYNTALLRAAAELAGRLGVGDFRSRAASVYNADLEKQGIPDSVKNFVAHIAAADALLIARRNIITPFRARLKMQLTGRRSRRRIRRSMGNRWR